MTKKNFKSKKLTKHELEKAIIKHFKKNPKKRLKPTRIIRALKIKNSKDSVQAALDKLVVSGKIRPTDNYKYQIAKDLAAERTVQASGDALERGQRFGFHHAARFNNVLA